MAIDMKAIHDSQRTLVMGVLNITEDSFSDGGQHAGTAAALRHCGRCAQILDARVGAGTDKHAVQLNVRQSLTGI